ncbi:ribosome maturation factor RimP [Candidatus Neomarinimicrobiota bacterium]
MTEILKAAEIQEPYHILESSFMPMGTEGQLRLIIDKPSGVTIQDLAMLTRKLGKSPELAEQLGIEDLRVDISSPGVTADLTQKWQYERHKGRKLKVILKSDDPADLKIVEGIMESMDDSGLSVVADSTSRNIPWDTIQKSNVMLDW